MYNTQINTEFKPIVIEEKDLNNEQKKAIVELIPRTAGLKTYKLFYPDVESLGKAHRIAIGSKKGFTSSLTPVVVHLKAGYAVIAPQHITELGLKSNANIGQNVISMNDLFEVKAEKIKTDVNYGETKLPDGE